MLINPTPYQARLGDLPPDLAAAVGPTRQLSVCFSTPERQILRKRADLPCSEWAERHRVMSSKASARPGPWRNAAAPWLAGIMDAAGFPSVREVGLCKAPQFGGSEAVNNIIGKIIDRDPGPVLYIYPGELDARRNLKRRVLDMIESSPRLAQYLTGRDDDKSSYLINLRHMTIRAGWSGSVQSLASTHERYIVFEEVDKYADLASARETDPISLGKKRGRTYAGREKFLLISSPTIEAGPIWQFMQAADVIFEFWPRCPRCGEAAPMRFGDRDAPHGIKWPAEIRDPNRLEADLLAWYQCGRCNAHWDDHLRDRAVAAGAWRQKTDQGNGLELFDYLTKHRPKKICFHGPSWISSFVSLSTVAADFLRGQKDKSKLRDFANGHAAEPWLEYHQPRQEDQILALRDDRPEGLVPGLAHVAGLLAGVDTQLHGFYYKIVAQGYGLIQESWLVKAGFVTSFEALAAVLWEHEYRDAAGNIYPVQLTLQDARYRTAEVYDFCSRYRHLILPAMGQRTKSQPFSYTNIEYYPGTKKAIPGGLQLVMVNTTFYKDQFSTRLGIAATDPGAFHLHADATEDYARQLLAEYKNDQGFWEQIGSRANHYWDCGVLIQVAADIKGIKHWPTPQDQPPAPDGPQIVARFKR